MRLPRPGFRSALLLLLLALGGGMALLDLEPPVPGPVPGGEAGEPDYYLEDARLTRFELPSGRVAQVFGPPTNLNFELHEASGRGSGDGEFLRVWPGGEQGVFPEDSEWSNGDGEVILAARRDVRHIWHDVTTADVERLICAMRWVVLHGALGGSRAA